MPVHWQNSLRELRSSSVVPASRASASCVCDDRKVRQHGASRSMTNASQTAAPGNVGPSMHIVSDDASISAQWAA